MAYVVFDINTTVAKKSFLHYGHANAYARRLNEKENSQRYVAYHEEFWLNYVVYYRRVKNIMSGIYIQELSSTPYYLSVGSETYWSA